MASASQHENSYRWNEKSLKHEDSLDPMPHCGLRSPAVPIDERLAIPADPTSLLARIAPCFAALLLLLLSSSSAAWGPNGHRITGEIAWRSLTPATKTALGELLPEGHYATLAEAAAWADTYARNHPREYRWLEPFHFVDADPRAEHVVAGPRCECVVAAIEIHADRLRDPKSSMDSKIEALRLVAHFVGDVHQPLHVSHPDMRGGTTIDLRFAGDPMTLHRLWDTALLERKLRTRSRGRSPRWRAFAHSLADSADAAERARWTASLDPHSWADESLALSKQPVFAVRRDAALDAAYYEESMPIVEERLVQAGVRLGALLDSIFDPAARLQ
jgi:S1/P1 Nuclease